MDSYRKTSLLFGFALLAATTTSLAGELSASVDAAEKQTDGSAKPVSWSIGDSKPLASYKVMLTNESSSSTKNKPRFVATAYAIDAGGNVVNAKVVFDADSENYCTADPLNDTSIDCRLPALAPGESSKEFTVSFVSPTNGDKIWLDWLAVFDNGDSPGYSNGDAGDYYIDLVAVNPNSVTSYIPAGREVTLATGSGVATSDDPWVTKVNVPAGGSTTASVDENANETGDCPPGLTNCSTSNLKIPGTFPGLLEITLIRDSSTIPRGAKIADAVVYYRKDGGTFERVLPCADDPPAPTAGKPCEYVPLRFAYPRKNSPKGTQYSSDYLGDWEFVIYALDNGKYAN
jgi:hypothetical protein